MFNTFKIKHFNFFFQNVLLGEIKCLGFTPNHFLKVIIKQIRSVSYIFFCSDAQPKGSCLVTIQKKT